MTHSTPIGLGIIHTFAQPINHNRLMKLTVFESCFPLLARLLPISYVNPPQTNSTSLCDINRLRFLWCHPLVECERNYVIKPSNNLFSLMHLSLNIIYKTKPYEEAPIPHNPYNHIYASGKQRVGDDKCLSFFQKHNN